MKNDKKPFFKNGKEDDCAGCGLCSANRKQNAIEQELFSNKPVFNREKCNGCGKCTDPKKNGNCELLEMREDAQKSL